MPNKIVPSSYRRLITDITALYEGARKALVEAYWKIGQRIVEVEQKGEIKAAYGTGLLQKLSADLTQELGSGFSSESLRRMRLFYLHNPKSSPARKLTWAHHIELLSVHDEKKRLALERRTEEGELDRDALRALIHHELVREQVAQNLEKRETDGGGRMAISNLLHPPSTIRMTDLLTPIRGTLFTYRIVQPKLVGAGESELLIDLGFSCTKDLDNITNKKFEAGDIVTSSKDAKGNYTLRLQATDNRPQPGSAVSLQSAVGSLSLYTYRAEVEKVVDGDTLRVIVDLGFGIKTRQYLRFRGIDCPEMDTPEGKKASDFVKARIRVASEIVLTSSRSDKYDRYLADVFYANKNGKEVYLNNAFLENGLAVRMSE